MSNAKKLSLAPASFTALLDKMGVAYTEQSGFVRVEGPQGRRMYVAKGKICTTVHLSGWTSANGDSVPLLKSPSKKVEHEMRFDETDGLSQMRLFARLVEEMKALEPNIKTHTSKASSPASAPVLIDPALVLIDEQPEARAEEA